MAIKAWGPLFGWLALAGAGIIGLMLDHPEPHNRGQPTVAPYKDSRRAELVAPHTDNQNGKKREQERGWIEGLFDKPTDTLLVVFNGLLVLFTGLLFRATSGLFKETAELRRIADEQRVDLSRSIAAAEKSAEVAERALIAAHRPWVKVDIQVGGPIFYNVNGANFTLKYILKNIGHSPATNVHVSPRVIAPIIDTDATRHFNPRVELQKHITELKKRLQSPFGLPLFPEEIIIQEITVTMSQDEIKRATKIIEAIYPTIIGAVDYRIGFDDKPHQTGFIVEVRRNDVPRPATIANKRWQPAIFVDEGDVPTSEVRLFRSILEGGYAD